MNRMGKLLELMTLLAGPGWIVLVLFKTVSFFERKRLLRS